MKRFEYKNNIGLKLIRLYRFEAMWCVLSRFEIGINLKHKAILLGRLTLRYLPEVSK